ncbi:hypothetical protein OS493_022065 [Desmophyllum pertusum]|uniref:Uncharacterized protein n=1 Tax=Desmophyllum pertusum TaxID=174260 RepID=A0A9X0CJB8_9CNID|nr:hypothetical protein OS493_022065 [Desmophyllum pertusum]
MINTLSVKTLPYTIQETKTLLLQIIEWQFLACDMGEDNPACDLTWLEEEEPVTPVTDSWAQGSVPIMLRPLSASSKLSVQSDRESELSSIAEERRKPATGNNPQQANPQQVNTATGKTTAIGKNSKGGNTATGKKPVTGKKGKYCNRQKLQRAKYCNRKNLQQAIIHSRKKTATGKTIAIGKNSKGENAATGKNCKGVKSTATGKTHNS